MQTLDYILGLQNCLELSQPSSCLDKAMKTRKKVLYRVLLTNNALTPFLFTIVPLLWYYKPSLHAVFFGVTIYF